jgi:luciferase family oxidoreductase group 1
MVAEQFGTLEALFPGRIDLGLGRARGTDALTARALRRRPEIGPDDFPNDVRELMAFFNPAPEHIVRAVPGAGLQPALWILGSSLFGAALAARLGLPYAFASHFQPTHLMQAIELYRARFRPSEHQERPYVMLGINVCAAETDDDGRRLFTSVEQAIGNLRRGAPAPLPPPLETHAMPPQHAPVDPALEYSFIGSPDTVRRGLESFIERTGADELMVVAQIFDHAARLRSLELTAQVRDALAGRVAPSRPPTSEALERLNGDLPDPR